MNWKRKKSQARPPAVTLPVMFSILLLTITASLFGDASGRSEYAEVTDLHKTLLTSWEVRAADGYLLVSRASDGDTHELFVDPSLDTRWWKFRSPTRGIDIRAVREGERISVSGSMDGREIRRALTIDSTPWYQSIEKSLEPVALGQTGTTVQFWIVEPYSLTPRKIQAVREAVDTIEVQETPTRAARIKISLPGFLSLFWSSRYWYRTSDGKFVRFEGLHGPPGSPLTVVQLLRELP